MTTRRDFMKSAICLGVAAAVPVIVSEGSRSNITYGKYGRFNYYGGGHAGYGGTQGYFFGWDARGKQLVWFSDGAS